MHEPPKPTPEEIKAACADLEAEIDRVGWRQDPERMNAKAKAVLELLRRARDDFDA